jgi:hypothetical protein
MAGNAYSFKIQQCPSCAETIVIREKGRGSSIGEHILISETSEEVVVYPEVRAFSLPPEVPTDFAKDFEEAHAALEYSAKASAALSRRLLQRVLREKLGIQKRDLSQEIEEFIASMRAPTYLVEAIDAVRQIGNFAAHPIKFTNTGEIVDVEPGEAEWLLEVLESLVDFAFVQPARLEQRRKSLNEKLKSLGKPPRANVT